MRILLIDDNLNDMAPFCDEFRLDGYEIEQAHNCETLKSICEEKKKYDFIILDLMMPPGNGIPVAESELGYTSGVYLYEKLIKNSFNNCPFIVLSAMDTQTALFKKAITKLKEDKNFKGYLSKPTEIEEIIDLISHS